MKGTELSQFLIDSVRWLSGNDRAGPYRDCVVAILLLKHIIDRHESECDMLVSSYVSEGHEEDEAIRLAAVNCDHVIKPHLPKEITWKFVTGFKEGLFHRLNSYAHQIEELNPTYKGTISYVDFSIIKEDQLDDLVHRFSCFNLGLRDFGDGETLDSCYLRLLAHFPNEVSGGNYYYAPQSICLLLPKLLKLKNGSTIYDPTAGAGNLLISSLESLKNRSETLKIFGQEANNQVWIACKTRMIFSGVEDDHIENSDSLRQPIIANNGDLRTFDFAISNPPFSLNNWGAREVEYECLNRFPFGIPTEQCGDYAYIQHVIASLNSSGRAAILLPYSTLVKNTKDKYIRQGLVEEDLIEAVIGLPSGIFYNTSLHSCIMLLNKDKPEAHCNKIAFIDAIDDYTIDDRIRIIKEAVINRIESAFNKFEDEGAFCKIADKESIQANSYSLNVRLYANNSITARKISNLITEDRQGMAAKLSSVTRSIYKPPKGKRHKPSTNAIYIPASPSSEITADINGIGTHNNYFQVILDDLKLDSRYACLFFSSELGKLLLKEKTELSVIQKLKESDVRDLNILLPNIDTQTSIVRTSDKLRELNQFITTNQAEISTNFHNHTNIEIGADRLLDSLADLSEEESTRRMIGKGESVNLEFKQTLSLDLEIFHRKGKLEARKSKKEKAEIAVLKTIVAFLNTKGGSLLIGVNDKGKVVGINDELSVFDNDSEDKFNLRLENLLDNNIGKECIPYRSVSSITIDEKTVIKVDVDASNQPFFRGDSAFYVRNLASSVELKGRELVRYLDSHFGIRQQKS